LAGEGSGYVVTKALIAVTLGVYLLQILDTGDIRDPGGELYFRGALFGPLIEDGEWWRLVTNAFLHGSPLHILFNLLMLWWFGRPLELLLGRGRFVGIFAVSILAGSAGALLYKPDVPTIGASGAVFGILGAGLVLERNRIDVFGGAALLVVAFNLVFSFVLSYVSIGGHVGGLVGGALAMLAMTQFGRQHAVYGRLGAIGVASLVGVGAASVLLAFLSVYGYV
jgi:membrane associated rhomboid family serine protease